MSFGEIAWTEIELPAAELGPPSPLPAFTGLQQLPTPSASPELSAAMRERMAYGQLASPLPYALQNGYRRDLPVRRLRGLELRNDRVSAIVLPQLGGRVWSLRDRLGETDLVFENPQLAFANLALTDAWFAGGIEWNLGSTGHATTTARPVFAARIDTERGPVLRLWEWERTRDLVFQVDLCLPYGSPLMLASIRVRNPDPSPKPLYWWSNIAVAEHPGLRVIAPADQAWHTAYDGDLSRVAMPFPHADADASYPLGAPRAADYFYDIPHEQRPWIAAVQADGSGLVQISTPMLRGRKMFCWGSGNGGQRWQQWLCGPKERYMEIQAGLAPTQLEHLRLEGGAEISWTEAYGPVAGDAERLHGSWTEAQQEVEVAVEELVGSVGLTAWHDWWRVAVADQPPAELLASGSAAGLAELTVRGQAPDAIPGTPFAETDDTSFQQLVQLAQTGTVDDELAARQTMVPPIGERWGPVLAQAEGGWWGELMIAVRAHARGDLDAAALRYQRSLDLGATGWACRGLALVAVAADDRAAAVRHYGDAVHLEPGSVPLLVEAAEALLRLGRAREALRMLTDAPVVWREHGRLTLVAVRGLIATGARDQARTIVEEGFEVADLREGESLADVWTELFPGRSLDYRYDFRMRTDGP